jgi:glucose dehydrogenase
MKMFFRYTTVLAFSYAGLIAGDWQTFGADPQRSGWAKNESNITKDNVKSLQLEWKIKFDNAAKELNSLTVPVVIDGVITPHGFREYAIIAGASDTLYAVDTDTGRSPGRNTSHPRLRRPLETLSGFVPTRSMQRRSFISELRT